MIKLLKPRLTPLRPRLGGGSTEGMSSKERSQHRRDTQWWMLEYGRSRWRRIRKRQLDAHPLCRMCEEQGIVTIATICDHITPHRGDPDLFWSGPFQSLCASHHSGDKQSEERTGRRRRKGVALDGWPLDPKP